MTATLTPSICCDECGVIATGEQNGTVTSTRWRLQQSGWETLRVGNGLRDFCPRCAVRRREVAA